MLLEAKGVLVIIIALLLTLILYSSQADLTIASLGVMTTSIQLTTQ